jgi:hypothetical protein
MSCIASRDAGDLCFLCAPTPGSAATLRLFGELLKPGLHDGALRNKRLADSRNVEIRSFERGLQPFRDAVVEIMDFATPHFERDAGRLPQSGVVKDSDELNTTLRVFLKSGQEIAHVLFIDVTDLGLRRGMLPKVCPVGNSTDMFFHGSGGDIDDRDMKTIGVRQSCLFKRNGAFAGSSRTLNRGAR